MKMIKIEQVFLFVVFVLSFQITRNINVVGYVGALFLSYLCLYGVFFLKKYGGALCEHPSSGSGFPVDLRTGGNDFYNFMRIAFILTLLWIPITSISNLYNDEYMIAFSRYFVSMPFILFCFLNKSYSLPFVLKILRYLVFFIAFAALSLPYQFFLEEFGFLLNLL